MAWAKNRDAHTPWGLDSRNRVCRPKWTAKWKDARHLFHLSYHPKREMEASKEESATLAKGVAQRTSVLVLYCEDAIHRDP